MVLSRRTITKAVCYAGIISISKMSDKIISKIDKTIYEQIFRSETDKTVLKLAERKLVSEGKNIESDNLNKEVSTMFEIGELKRDYSPMLKQAKSTSSTAEFLVFFVAYLTVFSPLFSSYRKWLQDAIRHFNNRMG